MQTNETITGQLARELIELMTDYNSWEEIRHQHPEYTAVKEARDKAYDLLLPYNNQYVQAPSGVHGFIRINSWDGWRPVE